MVFTKQEFAAIFGLPGRGVIFERTSPVQHVRTAILSECEVQCNVAPEGPVPVPSQPLTSATT